MKRLLTVFVSSLLFASCAMHTGNISSTSINRNVEYVDIAYGVSQTQHIFGFGGLSKDALVLEAKRELITNRPLKSGEEYVNFTVDFKRSFWPVYNQSKVTVSADVIRSVENPLGDPFTEKYKNKLSGKSLVVDLFCVGDSVMDEKGRKGTIISVEGTDVVRILFKTDKDKIRTRKRSITSIYAMDKSHHGLKTGDHYVYPEEPWQEQKYVGTVVALGVDYFLMSDSSHKLLRVKYKKN